MTEEFSQVEFNNLCDSYILARAANERFNHMARLDLPVSKALLLANLESLRNLQTGIQKQLLARGRKDSILTNLFNTHYKETMLLLDSVAIAIFHVAPNLDDEEAEGIELPWNPLMAWMVTFLQRTFVKWHNTGVTNALAEAARNTEELNNE